MSSRDDEAPDFSVLRQHLKARIMKEKYRAPPPPPVPPGRRHRTHRSPSTDVGIGFVTGAIISVLIAFPVLYGISQLPKLDLNPEHTFPTDGRRSLKSVDENIVQADEMIDNNIATDDHNGVKVGSRKQYVADELIMSERVKMLVQVTSSDMSYVEAINQTWAQGKHDVAFFFGDGIIEGNQPPDFFESEIQHGSSIAYLGKMLEHICQHSPETYAWYLLVKDQTYVNIPALEELIDRLPNGEDIIICHQGLTDQICRSDSGILISRHLIQRMCPYTGQCVKGHPHLSWHKGLVMCVKQTTKITPSPVIEFQEQFYTTDKHEDIIKTIKHSSHPKLTIGGIEPSTKMYQIHFFYLIQILGANILSLGEMKEEAQEFHDLLRPPSDKPDFIFKTEENAQNAESSDKGLITWSYIDGHLTLHGTKPIDEKLQYSFRSNLNIILNNIRKKLECKDCDVTHGYVKLRNEQLVDSLEHVLFVNVLKSGEWTQHQVSAVQKLQDPAVVDVKVIM